MATKSNCCKYTFRIATACFALFVTCGLGTAHAGESIPAKQPQTLDDLFAAVAQQVPEFGGMFLPPSPKRDETLQVYLTDVSIGKVAAVKIAIVDVFGAGIISGNRINPLRGQYGFLQLRKWYTEMAGVILNTPGVTLTDINEATNRLVIGLKPEAKQQVMKVLRGLSIPLEAVTIVETGPSVPLKSVQDTFRPTEGGSQIVRKGLGGACTLGFNANRQGVAGFVTASHCTNNQFLVDGVQFYQAVPNIVGMETVDPPGFTGLDIQHGITCPGSGGVTCRYSDSAFVKYDAGVVSVTDIARTTGLTTSGNFPILTINLGPAVSPNSPYPGIFSIVAPPSYPYLVNLVLNKVGRTTGWTKGQIDATCVDIPIGSFILLCQYTVVDLADIVNLGDSGSPVFRIVNSSLNFVELYGIVWGSQIPPTQGSGPAFAFKKFIFSPIGGVCFQQTGIQSLKDLGKLDNYASLPLPGGAGGARGVGGAGGGIGLSPCIIGIGLTPL